MGSLGYERGESIGWEGLWRSERLEGMDGPNPEGMGAMKGLEGLRDVKWVSFGYLNDVNGVQLSSDRPMSRGIQSMLLLSDGLPNTTIYSLDRHFPHATKVNL
jgi:hypothetical protein